MNHVGRRKGIISLSEIEKFVVQNALPRAVEIIDKFVKGVIMRRNGDLRVPFSYKNRLKPDHEKIIARIFVFVNKEKEKYSEIGLNCLHMAKSKCFFIYNLIFFIIDNAFCRCYNEIKKGGAF